jgi:hypothetical protein
VFDGVSSNWLAGPGEVAAEEAGYRCECAWSITGKLNIVHAVS